MFEKWKSIQPTVIVVISFACLIACVSIMKQCSTSLKSTRLEATRLETEADVKKHQMTLENNLKVKQMELTKDSVMLKEYRKVYDIDPNKWHWEKIYPDAGG